MQVRHVFRPCKAVFFAHGVAVLDRGQLRPRDLLVLAIVPMGEGASGCDPRALKHGLFARSQVQNMVVGGLCEVRHAQEFRP